jgi:hypothetical protein
MDGSRLENPAYVRHPPEQMRSVRLPVWPSVPGGVEAVELSAALRYNPKVVIMTTYLLDQRGRAGKIIIHLASRTLLIHTVRLQLE